MCNELFTFNVNFFFIFLESTCVHYKLIFALAGVSFNALFFVKTVASFFFLGGGGGGMQNQMRTELLDKKNPVELKLDLGWRILS